jgi:hypothetical protein
MIVVTLKKLEPKDCPTCESCVRRLWGVLCQNTCSLNEEVTFMCPFCGAMSSQIGARFTMKPLTCKKCYKDLSMLDRMMDVLNSRLRIEFHKSC